MVIQDDDGKTFLKFIGHIEISYHPSLSYINFRTRHVYFDKSGYFDPSGINWTAKWQNSILPTACPMNIQLGNNSAKNKFAGKL